MQQFWKISGLFLEEKPSIFPKRPKNWTLWEFLVFQSHFAANLLQFNEKKNSRSETWTNIPLVWMQLANIGWKKTSEIAHSRGRFFFHILNMPQNNEWKTQFLELMSIWWKWTLVQLSPQNVRRYHLNYISATWYYSFCDLPWVDWKLTRCYLVTVV